jgi:vanillate/4-hydroxybenzoate decarboxylase subunit D
MTNTPVGVCPRCQSGTVDAHAHSAVAGVWTVFGCKTCFYTWRSTEPAENTDPAKYPAIFKLRPDDLTKLPMVPSITPKRG